MRWWAGPLAGVVAMAALAAGCGGDVENTAIDLIEGEIADQIGLGDLDAECPENDGLEVGDTFSCTATLPDGRIVTFEGELDREDHIFVAPTNVIASETLPDLEELLAGEVASTIDVPVSADQVDCGPDAVVLDPDGVMVCAITDTDTGDVYDLTITWTDLSAVEFSWELAAEPRG